MAAKYEWRGWNPDTWQARFTGFDAHPQAVDQAYLVNWNNKQAKAYRSSDDNAYSSTYRSVLLEDRVKRGDRRRKKMTLPQLIDAMEEAGTGDLRAWVDLPLALKVIGKPSDPALRDAVSKLRAWRRDGGQRRDQNKDGVYEHSDAIRIMDAWWPRWVEAQFKPALGPRRSDADQDGRDRQLAQRQRRAPRLLLPGLVLRLRLQGPAQRPRRDASRARTRAATAGRSSAAATRSGAR